MTILSTQIRQDDPFILDAVFVADKEQTAKIASKAIGALRNSVMVPGFRKGKAPTGMLLSIVGNQIDQKMTDEFFPEGTSLIVADDTYHVIQCIKASGEQNKEDGTFQLSVSYRLGPTCEIPDDLSSLQIPITPLDIEGNVDAYIEQLRERNASLLPADHDDARVGDVVVLSAFSSVQGPDGEITWKQTDDHNRMEIQDYPGNAPFIGHHPEEEFEFEDAQGKFKVVIHSIQKKELPELNDDFVMDVSEFDTLEEFKANYVKEIEIPTRQNVAYKNLESIANCLYSVCKISDIVEYATTLVEESRNYLMELNPNVSRKDIEPYVPSQATSTAIQRVIIRALKKKANLPSFVEAAEELVATHAEAFEKTTNKEDTALSILEDEALAAWLLPQVQVMPANWRPTPEQVPPTDDSQSTEKEESK